MLPTGWTIRVYSVPRRVATASYMEISPFGGLTRTLRPSPRSTSTYFERRRTSLDQRWTWDHRAASPLTLIGPNTIIGDGFPFSIGGDRTAGTWYYNTWKHEAKKKALYKVRSIQNQWPLTVATVVEDTEGQLPVHRTAIYQDAITQLQKKRREAFVRTLSFTVPVTIAVNPTSFYATDRCEVLSEIQRHLLEPTIDGGATWSSGLWTADEVDEFLTLRINRFVLETMMISNRVLVDVVAGTGDYELPQEAMESLRIVFTPSGGSEIVLDRIDAHVSDNSYQTWQTVAGSPVGYIEYPSTTGAITIVPTPTTAGVLTVDYVPREGDPTMNCQPIPIPNQFAWAVKWGVIADLLSQEGEANDPVRADKAEKLFQLGVELAKLSLSQVR